MSTKIKLIGALLSIAIVSVIGTTIYLNQQNSKDALVINIAGKQRMLTQKIAKDIFYMYYNSNKNFNELNYASNEFINGLNILKNGDESKGIVAVNTKEISNQLKEVSALWDEFYDNVQKFKLANNSNANKELQ